jgi:hypothetical protein
MLPKRLATAGVALVSFILLLLCIISFSADEERYFSLGSKKCTLRETVTKPGAITFIALHDNENTAVEAFHSWTDELNINLLELHQRDDRYLAYQIGAKVYSFDPNQMFTEEGIVKTLHRNNAIYPKELEYRIKQFADSLLSLFIDTLKQKYTIAIHNNTEESFSVMTYKNSGNANQVFIAKEEDIDDFFIVTDSSDFEYFKFLNQNVVWQSEQAEDDGSLSVYCQKNGVPYINIEAQHGHLAKQIDMIKLAYNLVSEKAIEHP